MRKIAALAVALLLAGCTGGDRSVVEKWGGALRLVIDPPIPVAGTIPDHVLVNETDETIGYGRPFVLEQQTPDGWRRVRSRCGFTLEGLSLAPGESSPPAPVACPGEDPPLESGVYRVTKEVDVGDDYDRDVEILVATFTVF